jgi:uncharacterized DUF497 family protein
MIDFDWDEANLRHIALHNVRPEEAEFAIQNDPLELAYEVEEEEERVVDLGATHSGRIMMLVSTWRGERVRVVTACDAPKVMRTRYLAQRGESYGRVSEGPALRKRKR